MEFTQEESAAMRAEYGKGATDTQWELFLSECKARNLRPGVHLVFQLRNAKEYDPTVGASTFVKKAYWITTISALRLIAQRTGEYLGQAEEEYLYLDSAGLPSVVSNVPLPDPADKSVAREPWVVRTKVYRKGFQEPMVGVARFEAYAGTQKVGDKIRLTDMWSKRGAEQLSKCSEALALRKAFPEEMGSLYIAEELKNETEEAPQQSQPQQALAAAPSAPIVPKVNQEPAVGTETPRPNEPIPTLEQIVLNKTPEDSVIHVQIPAETPKPKTRKKADPKPEPIPVTGKLPHDREDLGITDEDIANAGKPFAGETPEEKEQRRADSVAFVEDISSVTPVPDRLPDEAQGKAYVARVRELVKTHGVSNGDVGKYVFGVSGKSSSKELTVGNWDSAFEKLDAAAVAGTLKELVKQ